MDNISAVWPNWKTESFIGQGAFGKVYKVKREINGVAAYAAVKVIEMPRTVLRLKNWNLQAWMRRPSAIILRIW